MKRYIFSAMLALAAAWLAMGPTAAQGEQYLIVAKGNGFSDAFDAAIKNAGGTVGCKLAAIGVAVARSDDPDFLIKAAAIPEVQAVGPDPELPIDDGIDAVETLPIGVASPWGDERPDLTSFQWAREAIHADEAGLLGLTGKRVRVVVMDGSIMTQHPDLVDNLNLPLCKSFVPEEGIEFVPGGVSGNFSHATHVAGIIAAADNGFGTTGVAPRAELVLAKVGRDEFQTIRPSAAIAALVYAADIHADVVNMSWAVYLWKFQASWWAGYPTEWQGAAIRTACQRAANYAHQHGVTLVAAAGNAALDFDHYGDFYIIPTRPAPRDRRLGDRPGRLGAQRGDGPRSASIVHRLRPVDHRPGCPGRLRRSGPRLGPLHVTGHHASALCVRHGAQHEQPLCRSLRRSAGGPLRA
jgi:hypothetical protein